MTKLDAGLITSLPASDSGSAAVWGSKRINSRPQSCLCLAWSGCPSNDDDEQGAVVRGAVLILLRNRDITSELFMTMSLQKTYINFLRLMIFFWSFKAIFILPLKMFFYITTFTKSMLFI